MIRILIVNFNHDTVNQLQIKKMITRPPCSNTLGFLLLIFISSLAGIQASIIHVDSPNQNQKVTLNVSDSGQFHAEIYYQNKKILKSQLGLVLEQGIDLSSGLVLQEQNVSTGKGTIHTRLGERASYDFQYNQISFHFKHPKSNLNLTTEFRLFDQAIAWRYILPENNRINSYSILKELTTFEFPLESTGFSEKGHEGEYFERPIHQIHQRCEFPLLIRNKKAGLFHAIFQSDAGNYSRRFLSPMNQGNLLQVTLNNPVKVQGDCFTPWIVYSTANSEGALIEQNYIRDALVSGKAKEPDWIKPGKVIRLVDLNTKAGIEGIDFAVENGLQYVEYDAGWYGQQRDPKADATTPINGLDIKAVCEYGNKRGIGVILYINKIHFELQSDKIFPTLKQWGVKGLKFGFVDGRTQEGINNVHKWTKMAYDHQMVVDVHDNYRTTGIQMRLPNLLTVEGIRGNEWMPTTRHNVTLPFTRYIVGAGDYTICYLNGRIQSTHAHQLAISVTHFSPLQFVYWYGRPKDYTKCLGKEWFKIVPTTWDDTKVISGKVGNYYLVARRKGDDWFIGGITNEEERALDIPLDFLEKDGQYSANIYRDSETHELEIQRDIPVTSESHLQEKLSKSGGVAMVVRKI